MFYCDHPVTYNSAGRVVTLATRSVSRVLPGSRKISTGKSRASHAGKKRAMEEAAITFVVDDASPPAKTVQQQLPTDLISLQLHQQLPQQQQQLVANSLQQRQQQQSPKCGPHKRFQQQPVSPQRCHQPPQQEHQVARVPSSTEDPASAVDRSARSSTRGGCTEERVMQDVQPEHAPAQHPTRPMASINARAVDETVGCTDDVIMRSSEGHVHQSSHVSAAHDVTAVQQGTITTPVHIKAYRVINRRTDPSSASVVESPSNNNKIEGGEKEHAKKIIACNNVWPTTTTSLPFESFASDSTAWCQLNFIYETLSCCGRSFNESMTSSAKRPSGRRCR